MKNKVLITFLVITIVFGMIGISYFTYELLSDKKQSNKNEEKEYKLDVYVDSNNYLCKEKSEFCNRVSFSIKTKNENAKVLETNSEFQTILYEDDGIYIYYKNEDKYEKLSLENNYKSYYLLSDLNKIAGVRCQEKNNLYDYYSLDAKTILYDDYTSIWSTANYLNAEKDNKFYYLDMNKSEVVVTSDSNIVKVYNDYKLYTNNNKLYIEKLNNTEKVELFNLPTDRYSYLYSIDYYNKDDLISLGKEEYGEGIYVIISYGNGTGYEICYETSTHEVVGYEVNNIIEGMAKPVLYLYPEKTTNVKISFEHREYLTTTYPKYNNGWSLDVNPNGDMYDKEGKYYYALYWDEIRYNEVDFKEGFYVTGENAIPFLEEKLSLIGLNDKERNEFIMYWLPVLENNQKSLVYFELTEERERGNKLIIEPKPDSLLRVSIHIKKVKDFVDIKEQQLDTFERFGFIAVEWGGMTY